MNSLGSQLASLLQAKDSNPYLITVCVHILDILLLKTPNTVFSVFFPVLFSPLLFIAKQPFYSSISLQPAQFPPLPTPPECVERSVRSASRLLQVGSTMPRILDAFSVLVPALFHLYVFSLYSKWLSLLSFTLETPFSPRSTRF